MKKVMAVLNRIFTILLIAVLLFAGYVFFNVMRAGKDRVPSVFGYSFLQVATGSMEPTIPINALIVVHQTDASEVKVGDVITFYSPDPAIEDVPNTHRVTAIVEENGTQMFVTRGDAGTKDDPYPVEADRLIGVYVRHFMVGNLRDVLHSKYFFFFVLIVPLCIVIFFELLRFKKIAEKKEQQHEQNP